METLGDYHERAALNSAWVCHAPRHRTAPANAADLKAVGASVSVALIGGDASVMPPVDAAGMAIEPGRGPVACLTLGDRVRSVRGYLTSVVQSLGGSGSGAMLRPKN